MDQHITTSPAERSGYMPKIRLAVSLLFLMNAAFGLYGVIWTQLLADGLTLLLSVLLFRRVWRRLPGEETQGRRGKKMFKKP